MSTIKRYIINAVDLTAFYATVPEFLGNRPGRKQRQQNVCRQLEYAKNVWHLVYL